MRSPTLWSGKHASLVHDAPLRRRLHWRDVLEKLDSDERARGRQRTPAEGRCQIEHLRNAGKFDAQTEAQSIVAITVRGGLNSPPTRKHPNVVAQSVASDALARHAEQTGPHHWLTALLASADE